MVTKTLAKKIAQASLSKKAYDVVIMDLRKLTTMTDYFVVCSVDSDTQARAVADAVKHELQQHGEEPFRKEGYSEGRWILLDYVDVVTHIFHKDVRSFYNLEKLWGDAKFEAIEDKSQITKIEKKTSGVKKSVKKQPRKRTNTEK